MGKTSNNNFIEVLAETPRLKERVVLEIAGVVEENYLRELRELVKRQSLQESVIFRGYLSEEELFRELGQADLCINLRKYNTEGASWSLLEQLYLGKAVIVSEGGVFSELPEEVVVKVKSIEELREKWVELTESPEKILEIGNRAREFVRQAHNEDLFRREFLSCLEKLPVDLAKKRLRRSLIKDILERLPMPRDRKFQNKLCCELATELSRIFGD